MVPAAGAGSLSLYITDEAPSVEIGQGLCKHSRLERFNVDNSCFNEGDDLLLSVW